MAKSFTDSEVKWEMFILIFLEPLELTYGLTTVCFQGIV